MTRIGCIHLRPLVVGFLWLVVHGPVIICPILSIGLIIAIEILRYMVHVIGLTFMLLAWSVVLAVTPLVQVDFLGKLGV